MRYFIGVMLFFSFNSLFAQKDSSQRVLAITAYSGGVFAHTASVKNVKGARVNGFALEFSKQATNEESFQVSRGYPLHGISLAYFDFGTPILGHGFTAAYFFEPVYRLSDHLNFQFRGTVGAAYLSDPFDSLKNSTNKNYSLHFNPYLELSGGFIYRINQHISFDLSANFHHISNGDFHQPNAGLNWITASSSLLYYPGNNKLPVYAHKKNKDWKKLPPKVDIGLMFVPQQSYNYHWLAQRKFAAGIFAQVSKQVSRTDALTLGTEIYHNEITDAQQAPLGNSEPSLLAGVHIGHEFLLGKVIFSQQIGTYLTKHPSFFSDIYHEWSLRYIIDQHWQAGVGLKAHTDEADFIALRLSYRL